MSQKMPLFMYRARVEALAEKREGEPLYNESLEHAAIVIQSMLSHAQRSVKLLTGGLNRNAYGRRAIVEEVERFVEDNSHSLQILYEDESLTQDNAPDTHPFLQAVAGKRHVELRHVPRELQSRYGFHFMVVDRDSYRFEPSRKEFGAVVAFGDEEGGNNLEELFKTLWNEASPPPTSDAALR